MTFGSLHQMMKSFDYAMPFIALINTKAWSGIMESQHE